MRISSRLLPQNALVLTKREFSSCRDVEARVTALVDGPPAPLPEEILADAGSHRLVYHPQSHSDRLEISGFEHVLLQAWIKSAEALRKIVRDCRDS